MASHVTDQILIEPDGPHRPAFAVWGLNQDPQIQTASASGWLVPLELYPSVPAELLEGAYVDGFLYNRAEPTNVSEGPEAVVAEAPTEIHVPEPQAVEATAETRDEAPRKRRGRQVRKVGADE